jgi:hypothetical protein
MKKALFFGSKVLVAFIIFYSIGAYVVRSGTNDLLGYSWSDNVGWLSMNASSTPGYVAGLAKNYAVTLNNDGTLNGFAWSDDIGWIQFGNLSSLGFPSGTNTVAIDAKVDIPTGKVTGWVRALAACQPDLLDVSGHCTSKASGSANGGGWDGWISLSGFNYASPNLTGTAGVTYSSSTGAFMGYAWGSDVVGWVNFNLTSTVNGSVVVPPGLPVLPAPICTSLTQTPTQVTLGDSFNLKWITSNATSCTVRDTLNTIYSTATTSTSGISIAPAGTLTYTLSCANTNTPPDTCSKSVSVPVNTVVVVTPVTSDNSGLWLNNDVNKRLSNITIRTNKTAKVNWDVTGLVGYGYTACSEKVSSATKNLGTWTDGGTLSTLTSPNLAPRVTLSNLPIGAHTLFIQCMDPTNTLSPIASTSNSVKINVLPVSIQEN